MGEALRGAGWSASQPGDLRENRRGEKNKTHTLKTETKEQPWRSGAPDSLRAGPGGKPRAQHSPQERCPWPHTRHTQEPGTQQNSAQERSQGTFCAVSVRRGRGEALTVAEAMVERPRGRACDDGVLGDPCFGRGVRAKGDHTERKRGDDPQGVRVHGPGQLWAACLVR